MYEGTDTARILRRACRYRRRIVYSAVTPVYLVFKLVRHVDVKLKDGEVYVLGWKGGL